MAESYVLAALHPTGDWFAIFDGDWKLMWNSQGRSALYDLAADPGENTNVIAAHPDRVAKLEQIMKGYLAALPRSQGTQPAGEVDAATREALKSLGYIH
jgi:hypothetical protein